MLVFSSKTRVHFGDGCFAEAIESEKDHLGKRVLVVTTGGSLERLGLLSQVRDAISAIVGEENVAVFSDVQADPDIEEVRKAVEMGKSFGATCVVGFGGGSAMDAAKAAAVGIASDEDIEDYLLKGLTPDESTLPIIAVPTTSGTGSELSRGAIISCRRLNVKTGIRGDAVIPVVAIVDPCFTWSVPMRVTMETGFDAFAHAAESYFSIKANAFSEMLSERVIKTCGEALMRLRNDLDDHEARNQMAFASSSIGHNLRDVGNCLPHRMQYPVGALTGTSHGAGLMALYPAWFGHEFGACPEKAKNVLAWLGCGEASDEEQAREAMAGFISKLGVGQNLAQLGVTSDAAQLASMVTGNINSDRLSAQPGIIEKIYEESF